MPLELESLSLDIMKAARDAVPSGRYGSANQEIMRLLNVARLGNKETITLRQCSTILEVWNELREAIKTCKPASITYDDLLNKLETSVCETLQVRLARAA